MRLAALILALLCLAGCAPAPKVDVTDLEGLQTAYVFNGDLWSYSWESPAQIQADDLIRVCAYNNDLKLPQDWEGVYLPEVANAPAAQVEAAVQQRFDVSAAHLRTSSYYSATDQTYLLIGGFGKGGGMAVRSAKQNKNRLEMQLDLEWGPYTQGYLMETLHKEIAMGEHPQDAYIHMRAVDEQEEEVAFLRIPLGVLTVGLGEQGQATYISYDKLNICDF